MLRPTGTCRNDRALDITTNDNSNVQVKSDLDSKSDEDHDGGERADQRGEEVDGVSGGEGREQGEEDRTSSCEGSYSQVDQDVREECKRVPKGWAANPRVHAAEIVSVSILSPFRLRASIWTM